MGQPQSSKTASSAEDKYYNALGDQAQQSSALAAKKEAQSEALQQPAIDKYTALSKGDRTAALEASMPVLSQVSQGYQAAKQSILNSVPAGPARDKAISDLEMQKFTTTSGAQATAVSAAPDTLANIGSGLGAMSLQELGASISGYQSAGNLAGNVVQQSDQRKAQNLQLLGGLAGTTGSVAGQGIKTWGSDRRIKQDIFKVEDILDRISDIEVYSYNYVAPRYAGMDKKGTTHIGLMAQDVMKQFPEATGVDQKAGVEFLTVDPYAIASLALGAVKELTERVKALEHVIARAKLDSDRTAVTAAGRLSLSKLEDELEKSTGKV